MATQLDGDDAWDIGEPVVDDDDDDDNEAAAAATAAEPQTLRTIIEGDYNNGKAARSLARRKVYFYSALALVWGAMARGHGYEPPPMAFTAEETISGHRGGALDERQSYRMRPVDPRSPTARSSSTIPTEMLDCIAASARPATVSMSDDSDDDDDDDDQKDDWHEPIKRRDADGSSPSLPRLSSVAVPRCRDRIPPSSRSSSAAAAAAAGPSSSSPPSPSSRFRRPAIPSRRRTRCVPTMPSVPIRWPSSRTDTIATRSVTSIDGWSDRTRPTNWSNRSCVPTTTTTTALSPIKPKR